MADLFDDEAVEVFGDMASETPEEFLRILGEMVCRGEQDGMDRDALERAIMALLTAEVNLPKLINEHPAVTEEAFGQRLTFSDATVAKIDREIRQLD